MAKREFAKINYETNARNGHQPGDQAAVQAALALAQKADAPSIHALMDLLTTQDRIGGQAYITPFRGRNEGEKDFDTFGFIIDYETRDARVEFMRPPDSVDGFPVSGPHEEPTRIPVEAEEFELDPEDDPVEDESVEEPSVNGADPVSAEA